MAIYTNCYQKNSFILTEEDFIPPYHLDFEDYSDSFETLFNPQHIPNPLPNQQIQNIMATVADVLDYLKENKKDGNVACIEPFHGDGTQDPLAWIADFEKAAIANGWSLAKQRKIMPAFLRENVDEWQQAYYPAHIAIADSAADWNATKAAFIAQFCNQCWKNK